MALPNTHYGPEEITRMLRGKRRLFFAGIGGVSMNSLATVSRLRGYEVSGYDRSPSEITAKLGREGITVYYEADADHVKDADALIYTVAMPETNPEYAAAKERGIPLISRADYLGWLMTGYGRRIGVKIGTKAGRYTVNDDADVFAVRLAEDGDAEFCAEAIGHIRHLRGFSRFQKRMDRICGLRLRSSRSAARRSAGQERRRP